MWSACTPPLQERSFEPNHFVLLVECASAIDIQTVSDDSADDADDLPRIQPSVHRDAGEILTSDTDDDVVTGDMTERLPEDMAEQGHEDGEVAPSSPVNGSTYLADGMQPLPGGDWLTTCDIVAMLKQPPHDVHRRVPDGVKSNLFCLVDYEVNHARRQHGECRAFDDDCGAWNVKGGRTIVIPYLIESDGSMRRLFLHTATSGKLTAVDNTFRLSHSLIRLLSSHSVVTTPPVSPIPASENV